MRRCVLVISCPTHSQTNLRRPTFSTNFDPKMNPISGRCESGNELDGEKHGTKKEYSHESNIATSLCCRSAFSELNQDFSPVNVSVCEISIREPDVLCGRDKLAHTHPGNLHFRRLVSDHRSSYQGTKSRDEKARIIRIVISYISDKGGRFLKSRDEGGVNRWHELDATQVYDKVSHALRSAKPGARCHSLAKRAAAHHTPIVMPVETEVHEGGFRDLLRRQTKILTSLKKASAASSQLGSTTQPYSSEQMYHQHPYIGSESTYCNGDMFGLRPPMLLRGTS